MGSSSSVDKNVLVRSTNKTSHVPPKREMNPWLLTKLPPASSSPPPKNSPGPTTEGGNVVIVSDWLTERRTTPEDAASSDRERPDYNLVSTEEPALFTNSDHFTPELKQDFSSYGTMIIKNSDAITPVDEVIFTRIDGPKQNKEVSLEELTSVLSNDTQNKLTSFLFQGNSTESMFTEAPSNLSITNKDLKLLSPVSNSSEKQYVSEKRPLEITVHIQSPTEPPVKIQELVTNDKRTTVTEALVYYNALNITPEAKATEVNSATTVHSNENTLSKINEKDVMVENIFGPDELNFRRIEQETTTTDLFESRTTEGGESATYVNEFTENSLEEQSKEGPKVGKVKIPPNEVKTTLDGFSDTTTNNMSDAEVTTPFFTEVNLEKDNLNKHDCATELPKIKKDNTPNSNKSEITISTIVSQEVGSTRENTLFSGTDTITTSYPSEIKIKRNNFNSSSDQNIPKHNTEGAILLNNDVSTVPVTTQATTISEINSKSQNFILNNTSEFPSTGMSKYFALSSLGDTGDEFEDGMESTSDAPPVLELNSHVPFLQLGGHENTDSVVNTFGESYQTTTTDVKTTESEDKAHTLNFTNLGLPVKQIDSTDDKPSLKHSGDDNVPTTQGIKKENGGNDQVEAETTTDVIFPTSHIPLTPGDLKVIAEFLINDTIKTIPVKNLSDYVPNPWLKGNLTSEENMSSILSAANVSIAVMNKTDDKARKLITETTSRPGEAARFDKLEKDKLFVGNGAMNDLKVSNKTGPIQGKGDEYLDYPKINQEPETPLNDEAEEASVMYKTTKTESPNNIKRFTVQNTTPNIDENSPAKLQINNLKPRINIQFVTSTSQSPTAERRDSSDNDLRFDNVNPAGEAETNQYVQNNRLRNEKPSDVTTTPVTSSHPQTQLTP